MVISGPSFVHVNIVSRDWRKLVRFYMEVFGFVPAPPERHLDGDWFDKATGLTDASAHGIHLVMRDDCEPRITLEVLEFSPNGDEVERTINRQGPSHLAFRVDDVEASLYKVLDNGGTQLGEMVSKEIKGEGTVTFVYVRDPEGNILELQRWDG